MNNLKQILEAFIRHRREVVTRRTVFLLRKARERGHVLEGLTVALANIDEVIELIKASPSPAEASASRKVARVEASAAPSGGRSVSEQWPSKAIAVLTGMGLDSAKFAVRSGRSR